MDSGLRTLTAVSPLLAPCPAWTRALCLRGLGSEFSRAPLTFLDSLSFGAGVIDVGLLKGVEYFSFFYFLEDVL